MQFLRAENGISLTDSPAISQRLLTPMFQAYNLTFAKPQGHEKYESLQIQHRYINIIVIMPRERH
jgi:hypothetical protein